MVEEAAAVAGAGEGLALLEDDVAVPPSNDPDAVVASAAFPDLRILVAAMVGQDGAPCRLVTVDQERANGPFPPPGAGEPVNDVAYEPILATATAKDGRIAIVAVRADDKGVDFILQESGESVSGPTHPSSPGAEWADALDLGRPADVAFKALCLGLDAQGLISVFGVSQTGDVWWLRKNPPRIVETEVTITPPGASNPITVTVGEQRPADPPFSDWQKLAGAVVGNLALANNIDGRILLLAITEGNAGGDIVINEPRVMNATHPTDWYGWEPVGNRGLAPFSHIVALPDDSGAVSVFAVDSQKEVSHARQTRAGAREWTEYTHPGLGLAGFGVIAAGFGTSGNVVLGAVSAEGIAWTNREVFAADRTWSGWQPSARVPASVALEFEYSADEALSLFGLTPPALEDGTIWMITQAAPGSTEWSATTTPILKGAVAMSVARDLRLPAG